MIDRSVSANVHLQQAEDDIPVRVSTPRLMLHLEGAALLGAALFFYSHLGFAWSPFLILLLGPDLAFIPYMFNRKIGTAVYNALHTVTLPLALSAVSVATGWSLGIQLALIWLAHIGMDRTLGYGLKYADSFRNTHLSKV